MNVQLLLQILTIASLLLTILTFVWKAAKQSARIEDLSSRVDKLETQYKGDINDIKTAIQQINIGMAEIRTSFNVFKEYWTEKK